MGALLTTRQNDGVEEVDIASNHAYRYPPRSGTYIVILFFVYNRAVLFNSRELLCKSLHNGWGKVRYTPTGILFVWRKFRPKFLRQSTHTSKFWKNYAVLYSFQLSFRYLVSISTPTTEWTHKDPKKSGEYQERISEIRKSRERM